LVVCSGDGGVLDNGVTAPTAWQGSGSCFLAGAGTGFLGEASWAEEEVPMEGLKFPGELRPGARRSGGMRLTTFQAAGTLAAQLAGIGWATCLARTTAAASNAAWLSPAQRCQCSMCSAAYTRCVLASLRTSAGCVSLVETGHVACGGRRDNAGVQRFPQPNGGTATAAGDAWLQRH
jgi:hypothetical protein